MRSLYWLLRLSAPTFEPRLTAAPQFATGDAEALRPIRPGAFADWIKEREAVDRAAAAADTPGLRRAGAPSPLGGRP